MTDRQRQAWWPSFAVLVALLLSLTGTAGGHHQATSAVHRSGGAISTHLVDPALATSRLTIERGHHHPQMLATVPAATAPRSGFRTVALATIASAHSTRTGPGLSRAPPAAQL